ncbi:inverted formin-2-like isoform X3 [Ammospiza caudacuta]|uniref:inverted formin-2-like isoform X3 n=1 Tax=Ammospiza caudacuta TaxID=2857398 RepID=UPI0027399F45|nr:inverted formin-2-like isoform X3 [Ammospiza caudacuta]
MGPGQTMESLLSSMHCSNHPKTVPRRSVPKVNKCTQVNMDLEEKKSSADLSLSRQSEHSPGSTSPTQKDSSSSPQQSVMPALLPQLPPPPPLPPGGKVPLPPVSTPGMSAPSLPSPQPCSTPGCSHPACSCGEQPQARKTPTLRMKVLHWQKLPCDVVRQSHSIWAVMPSSSKELVEPDYASLELLFSVPSRIPMEKTGPKIKKTKEITFIGPKKSLLLSIFLKQFKCSNEEIAAMIQKGDRSKLDAEILRQLLKLLPEDQEINSLKSYKKEKSQLANADQFYLHLLEVPSYQLRIECMLICEETKILLECLWPKAQAIRTACETILTSHRLPVFCQLILKVGNFLNYGRHTGDAGGFKISALLKLTETKANQNNITLLHHILEEVEKKHRDLLQLPRDLDFVSKAVGIHFDAMQAEAGANLKKLLEIEKHLFLSTDDLKIQHGKSVQGSLNASKDLQKEFATIEKKKEELADYLCEDRKKLSLEDVFSTMKTFREIFLKTLQENQERKEQAAKSEKRKKWFKGEDAKRLKGEYGKCHTFSN